MRKTQKDLVLEYKENLKANGENTYVAEYMLESNFFKENMNHIPI